LMHTSRLTSKQHSKRRLLRTCFANFPLRCFYESIAKFNHSVYTGRWGSVLGAVVDLLPLHQAFTLGWHLPTYLDGAGVQEGERDGDQNQSQAKVNVVDEAIKSPLFWAYMVMLDLVADALLELCSWAEGCACHEEELRTLE
jgi:hypothetical protein